MLKKKINGLKEKQNIPGMQNKVMKMKNMKGKLRDMEFSYCFITIPGGKNKRVKTVNI